MSATTAPVPAKPKVTSGELFGYGDRILIEHGGGLYLLRKCLNGRLLLTRSPGSAPSARGRAGERREASQERTPPGLYGRIWCRN
jgi:hemin uptake protein HemP